MGGLVASITPLLVAAAWLTAPSSVRGLSIEREATVELIPNDLVESVHVKEVSNQTISSPQKVIENQIVKVARIVQQAFDDARRSWKQKEKRDAGVQGFVPYVFPLLSCIVRLMKSGMIPEPVVKGVLASASDSYTKLIEPKKPPLVSGTSFLSPPAGPLSGDVPAVSTLHGVASGFATGAALGAAVAGLPGASSAGGALTGTGLAALGAGGGVAGVPGVSGGMLPGAPLGGGGLAAAGTGLAVASLAAGGVGGGVPLGGESIAGVPVSGGMLAGTPLGSGIPAAGGGLNSLGGAESVVGAPAGGGMLPGTPLGDGIPAGGLGAASQAIGGAPLGGGGVPGVDGGAAMGYALGSAAGFAAGYSAANMAGSATGIAGGSPVSSGGVLGQAFRL